MFHPSNLADQKDLKLSEITQTLQDTYCSTIGADFREINDVETVLWLQEKMESVRNKPVVSAEKKKRILEKLAEAEGFEKFLQARYLGQKRFSLEGADALVPCFDVLLDRSKDLGVDEVCIGMAHRGRLNVLVNTMGKPIELMLQDFEGKEATPPFDIDGDVKYHQGYASEVDTASGKKIRLHLSSNPSHLEAVNPVVEGFVRARQKILNDPQRSKVLPVLIHGDAAMMGQGIVPETLNLSELEYYTTGGTIHIIINNQVGFTTDPTDSRSCTYCSEIAKVIRAPVLHVNADDPEAVTWVCQLATEYRAKFKKDFVIDLIGYRRHGHNETDEPSFTQPLMYKKIGPHKTCFNLYAEKLKTEGVVSEQEVTNVEKKYRDRMQAAYELVKKGAVLQMKKPKVSKEFEVSLPEYRKIEAKEVFTPAKTNVAEKKLKELGELITTLPKDFTPHPKVLKLIETRRDMVAGKINIDWPFAEQLAFISLASEGHDVRLSGQDCRRGTFSSRHATIRDFQTGKKLELLNHSKSKKDFGAVDVVDSPLSELGVMGFEFGYSVANANNLVLWEGQFGDFCNGAQIIIDQFLAASEAKWRQTSGLVLLLPHGYEGQGPEHSSARLERFLQLCGSLNMQVAIPTTAAQYFHILRRQIHRDFRKPLIIMSPKSLLRSELVTSPYKDFANQSFVEVIDEVNPEIDPKSVKRVIFCTGKVYYDLMTKRNAQKLNSVAIVRVEQLYPFPEQMLLEIKKKYAHIKDWLWVQEEPMNMGAWTFMQPRLNAIIQSMPGAQLNFVARIDSGSTAEGYLKVHLKEQERIVDTALGLIQLNHRQLA